MIRGATYEIEINIADETTGDAIDLTSAEGILVGLYADGKRLFGKWSLVDKSSEGYGEIIIVDAAAGKIKVALEADSSLNALEKMAKLEVLLAMTNPLFDNNLQISIDTEIELEKVERSIFEGITAL